MKIVYKVQKNKNKRKKKTNANPYVQPQSFSLKHWKKTTDTNSWLETLLLPHFCHLSFVFLVLNGFVPPFFFCHFFLFRLRAVLQQACYLSDADHTLISAYQISKDLRSNRQVLEYRQVELGVIGLNAGPTAGEQQLSFAPPTDYSAMRALGQVVMHGLAIGSYSINELNIHWNKLPCSYLCHGCYFWHSCVCL